MPTLKRLQQNAQDAENALADAEHRLALARERRRSSIAVLSALEIVAIDTDGDPAELAAAVTERDAAVAALATIEAELKPDRRPRPGLPAPLGS